MQKQVSFKNGKGLTLRGMVHIPKTYDAAVVFLHGFPTHYKGTAPTRIAFSLEKAGFLTLRFSYSHCQYSDGNVEDMLMSAMVSDTKFAIDYLYKHYRFKRLILIGQSTGAIVGALYAWKDKRIAKLVLTGVVSKLDEAVHYDFSDRQIRDFWMKGYARLKSDRRYYHRKKLSKKFYDEFFTLNIPAAIKKFKKPLLIMHGTADEAVPASKDPLELYDFAHKPKKLVLIKGASHSFKKHWKQYMNHLVAFIRKT
ncbi:alpha/beta hydrolase [Candidatus Woesearchaeota archaeon]|nr:MAG: alpha/beta hydrolase [Candidatus Woesearchaeota archaeon]